jgi:hypothetical protein
VPGTEILAAPEKPAFVIRAGETELALDIEIAEIYVKVLADLTSPFHGNFAERIENEFQFP